MFENYFQTRSRDYTLGFIQLSLDENGEGAGVIIPAAQIKFDDDGHLAITQYGSQPVRLINVKVQN